MDTVSILNDRRLPVLDSPKNVEGRTLAVTATYVLTEEGRKASLLAGGNGRALQEMTVEVPSSRLHLVSVDANGIARLKLRPRFELADDHSVVRTDMPPEYDAPPALEDLFREAARNHQLESTYYTERRVSRSKRRDASQDVRAELAKAFLGDPKTRALAHPPPTPKRCYLIGDRRRLLFDADTDELPARDVPPEAHRRFRADLRARAERNQQARAAQLAIHEEKKRAIADWISAHGSPEQRARQAAGMLPMDEAIEAMADEAFVPLRGLPRYARDGVGMLQAHVRKWHEYADAIVTAADLSVTSTNAVKATAAQWALVEQLQHLMPSARMLLRAHKLTWRRDPRLPALTTFGVLATLQIHPFSFRREFEAPPANEP
jgi:hypothetical protein